ncbi:MAG: short-chain dehydrogenase [Glaciihabitans sp.]|nr:short-chain dehydrogenase [Glaciihabitans sp.]
MTKEANNTQPATTSTDARLFPFRGQTVLITGAASGIGLATLETLHQKGANIIAVDVNADINELPVQVTDRFPRELDDQWMVSAYGDIGVAGVLDAILDEALGEVGGPAERAGLGEPRTNGSAADTSAPGALDAVVHCAAISFGGTALTTSFEDWQRVLNVNLSGAFHVAKSTLPRLIGSQGSLVLVASQLGMVGANNSVSYSASKGGVINLMRSLALDHGPQGARINCLCPGPTETPFLLNSFTRAANPELARATSLGKIPLGRFGTSQEVANGAVFLASRESSFVHGTTLVVDGGYLAN